mgnify:FL=1
MFLKDGKKAAIPKDFVDNFKKTVVFELCAGESSINPATGKQQFPVTRGILPFFFKHEAGTEDGKKVTEMVEHRFASIVNKVDGQNQYMPLSLDFALGRIVCDPQQKDALEICYMLSNHPRNQTNEKRDTTLKPIFYKVDPVRTAKEEMEIEKNLHEAKRIILEETDVEK